MSTSAMGSKGDFEDWRGTIEKINQTLQRNSLKTKEILQNTECAIKEADTYRSKSNRKAHTHNIRDSHKLYKKSLTTSLNFHLSSSHHASVPTTKTTTVQNQEPAIQTKESFSKVNDFNKGKPYKIKDIVFKTLDNIFQIRGGASREQKQNKSANISNPSHKGHCDTRNNYQANAFQERNVQENVNKNIIHALEREQPGKENEVYEVEAIVSSSESEDSWLYVDNPIQIEHVDMTDSLNYSSIKKRARADRSGNKDISTCGIHPSKTRHYSKKLRRNEDKIKQLRDLQHRKQSNKNLNKDAVVVPKTAIKSCKDEIRPDSPLQKAKFYHRLQPSNSLPNLIEMSFDENTELEIPDFSTNSFSREIALRPSSTLKSSQNNINHISRISVETNDDIESASSSFSFFNGENATVLDSRVPERKERFPVPSALCRDVLVMPISVPVLPLKNLGHIKGISSGEFKKLSEAFVESKEGNNKYEGNEMNFSEIVSKNTLQSHPENAELTEDEISNILEAFSWLKNVDEELSETNNASTTEIFRNQQSKAIFSNNETISTNKNISNNASTLNSSVPLPPPLPPPLPCEKHSDFITLKKRFPLKMFVQPTTGNNIFNRFKSRIEILESDALNLKEKFPLLENKSRNELENKTKLQENTSEAMKIHLNTELFLKKWGITGSKVDLLLKSIRSMNAYPDLVDMNCIAVLPISKKQVKKTKTANFSKTEEFLANLNSIPFLQEKLECIKFSLEFEELTRKCFDQIELFTKECHTVTMSPKFINFINVVMEFMNCLNNGEGPQLYGFDILSLNKLATKSSEDGSTTLLHFVIEYILHKTSFPESVDFYQDFKNLPAVVKISLADLTEQVKSWELTLKLYKQQLQFIKDDKNVSGNLDFPTNFVVTAENSLKTFKKKLAAASQAFNSCKESYALTNTSITESEFFESLSKFVNSYKSIHKEVTDRENMKQIKAKRRHSSIGIPSSKNPLRPASHPNRKSYDFKALPKLSSENVFENDSMDELGRSLFQLMKDKELRVRRKKS